MSDQKLQNLPEVGSSDYADELSDEALDRAERPIAYSSDPNCGMACD